MWTRTREKIVGDGPPRVSGHIAYRAVLRLDRAPNRIGWAIATSFGASTIRGSRIVKVDPPPGSLSTVMSHIARCCGGIVHPR
jgi:hypothetical protein